MWQWMWILAPAKCRCPLPATWCRTVLWDAALLSFFGEVGLGLKKTMTKGGPFEFHFKRFFAHISWLLEFFPKNHPKTTLSKAQNPGFFSKGRPDLPECGHGRRQQQGVWGDLPMLLTGAMTSWSPVVLREKTWHGQVPLVQDNMFSEKHDGQQQTQKTHLDPIFVDRFLIHQFPCSGCLRKRVPSRIREASIGWTSSRPNIPTTRSCPIETRGNVEPTWTDQKKKKKSWRKIRLSWEFLWTVYSKYSKVGKEMKKTKPWEQKHKAFRLQVPQPEKKVPFWVQAVDLDGFGTSPIFDQVCHSFWKPHIWLTKSLENNNRFEAEKEQSLLRGVQPFEPIFFWAGFLRNDLRLGREEWHFQC